MSTPQTAGGTHVYEPCEDSFLFLDVLEKFPFAEKLPNAATVLEIGSGSGVVSTFCAQQWPKAVYHATDINPWACDATQKTWNMNINQSEPAIEVLRASLVPFRPQVVDLLLFNPPYVPSETVPEVPKDPETLEKQDDAPWIYLALDGGADGMEVTWQLLNRLEEILSENGIALILFCARNGVENVRNVMQQKGWQVDILEKRKAGWEVLSIVSFRRADKSAA